MKHVSVLGDYPLTVANESEDFDYEDLEVLDLDQPQVISSNEALVQNLNTAKNYLDLVNVYNKNNITKAEATLMANTLKIKNLNHLNVKSSLENYIEDLETKLG